MHVPPQLIQKINGIDNPRALQAGQCNKSEKDIALFFISPSDSDDWGEDWLGDTDVILAETGGRIFFIEPATYDFMAIDVDGEVVFDVRDMEIDSRRVFIVE